MNKILVVIPTTSELACFLQACGKLGFHIQAGMAGLLPVNVLDELGLTVAPGGLGKVQFGVQTQHLLDACPGWGMVICAGAAGALADELEIGDVVAGTQTVEHDIHNRMGKPLMPSFAGDLAALAGLERTAQGLDFRVHLGPIASGDEDIVDSERRRAIHDMTGALAVAWEGAGGARACAFSGVPFVELRGITDKADHSAPADFGVNLHHAMRNVARVIVGYVMRDT